MTEFTNYRLADEALRHRREVTSDPEVLAAIPMPPDFGDATMMTATVAQHREMVKYLQTLPYWVVLRRGN